jgi:hypothetical protein
MMAVPYCSFPFEAGLHTRSDVDTRTGGGFQPFLSVGISLDRFIDGPFSMVISLKFLSLHAYLLLGPGPWPFRSWAVAQCRTEVLHLHTVGVAVIEP